MAPTELFPIIAVFIIVTSLVSLAAILGAVAPYPRAGAGDEATRTAQGTNKGQTRYVVDYTERSSKPASEKAVGKQPCPVISAAEARRIARHPALLGDRKGTSQRN
jgi:hypothetical protein